MSKAGARILEAARDAAAIARGDKKAARMHVPADIDVRAIRHKLKLSQEDFASEFGFSVDQIRNWEQRRSRPLGGLRSYLMIIERNPDGIRQVLADARRDEAA